MNEPEVKVEYISVEELKKRIAKVEKDYPRIPEIVAKSDCICCAESDVADVYGWDVASNEFREWDTAQWLLVGDMYNDSGD